MTPKTARNYLLYQLQSKLYSDFYIRGIASSAVWNDGVTGASSFVEALSAANMGKGSCESGWEVQEAVADRVVVRRSGLTLWVRPEDCLVPDGGSLNVGVKLRLRLPKELLSVSPGFYVVLGDRGSSSDAVPPLVRLYWNLTAEGAETFVRAATRLLNEAHLFFKLKVLSDPASYTRCDAAVVYAHKDDHSAVCNILGRMYPKVAPHLKPSTPIFTKKLAPGVGLAEDPAQAESFGQHRCRLLAEGMIRAYERRASSIDDRLEIVTDCYAASGIKLSQPYLNPGSDDNYNYAFRSP
jgi:hypothetical protein